MLLEGLEGVSLLLLLLLEAHLRAYLEISRKGLHLVLVLLCLLLDVLLLVLLLLGGQRRRLHAGTADLV